MNQNDSKLDQFTIFKEASCLSAGLLFMLNQILFLIAISKNAIPRCEVGEGRIVLDSPGPGDPVTDLQKYGKEAAAKKQYPFSAVGRIILMNR